MKTLISLTFAFMASSAFAAMPLHSDLVVEKKVKEAEEVSIQFIVKPHAKMIINFDKNNLSTVPWQLELSDIQGLEIVNPKLSVNEFKPEIPGFSHTAKLLVAPSSSKDKKAWRFSYRLVAFVCTVDKVQCFRDVHKGTVSAE